MQLQPPLSVDEIAISHRVGKPQEATDDTDEATDGPARPRPLLVKFSTRRSKNRVMATKKSLKLLSQEETDDEEYAKLVADGTHIYIADDLTKARAYLAFKAREAKRNGELLDTWVIDCKVMVKDRRSRIRNVKSLEELARIKCP